MYIGIIPDTQTKKVNSAAMTALFFRELLNRDLHFEAFRDLSNPHRAVSTSST